MAQSSRQGESETSRQSAAWNDAIDTQLHRLAIHYDIPNVRTYLGAKDGLLNPVWVRCDNRKLYVMKAMTIRDRSLTNDQVVARLAKLLNAPTGKPEIVRNEPDFAAFEPGFAHATEYIPGLIDTTTVVAHRVPENRTRYARLALLYGWLNARDEQLAYEEEKPHLVWSLDHHRFLGGERWNAETLQQTDDCYPSAFIQHGAYLSNDEVRAEATALDDIDHETIAQAVAFPKDSWAITMDDRIALATCIARRRDQLQSHLANIQAKKGG